MLPPDNSGKAEEVILGTNIAASPKATVLTPAAAANLQKLYIVLDSDGSSSSSSDGSGGVTTGGEMIGTPGRKGGSGEAVLPPPPPPPMTARGGVLVYNTAELSARPVVLDEQVSKQGMIVVEEEAVAI